MEIDPLWFQTLETDPFLCSGFIQFHIVKVAFKFKDRKISMVGPVLIPARGTPLDAVSEKSKKMR